MLMCITCSKQRTEDGARGTPSTKEAVKSLTAQIKDMALKISGSSKQSKPSTPGSYKRGQRPYTEFGSISKGVSYVQPGTSGSIPAWDFKNSSHDTTSRHDTRFTGALGGDQTPGGQSISAKTTEVVVEDEDEPKEWTAQVEPGIQITFISLPHGGNDLKRMRFCRDLYDKWEAQRWWAENYDRIMELYNVRRFNQQALDTPARSDNGRDSSYSRLGSPRESSMMTPSANREWARNYYKPSGSSQGHFPSNFHSSMDASRTTTSSRDEAAVSISNDSEMESEWVEQDEPGVYITIRQLADGTRELRRVRFSREKFGEVNAKLWWETNRERIQAQYL